MCEHSYTENKACSNIDCLFSMTLLNGGAPVRDLHLPG
jgi:hypothetical protein